jgi:hypothetical protein
MAGKNMSLSMRKHDILRGPAEDPELSTVGAGDVAADEPALREPTTETAEALQDVDPGVFENESDLAQHLADLDAAADVESADVDEEAVDAVDETPEGDEDAVDAVDEATEADDAEAASDEEPTEDATEEDESEDEDESEASFKDLPKEHRGVVRELIKQAVTERTGKLSEQRTELEAKAQSASARAEQLEAEMTQLRAEKVVPMATPEDPLADVAGLPELEGIQVQAERLEDWLDRNLYSLQQQVEDPESGEMRGAVLPHPLDPEKEIGLDAALDLRTRVKQDLRALPKKRAWFQERQRIEQQLAEKVPSLKDPKSDLSVDVAKTIASMPWMKQSPGYKAAAVFYNVGRQLARAADESGVGVETLLTRLSKELGGKQAAEQPKVEDPKPKVKPQARSVRAVPAVRKQRSTTRKARPAQDSFIDSHEDLVATLEAMETG